MTRKLLIGYSTQAQINLTLPLGILNDLNKIMTNSETNLQDLIRSFIIQGIVDAPFSTNQVAEVMNNARPEDNHPC